MVNPVAELSMIRNSTLHIPDPERAAKTNAGSVAACISVVGWQILVPTCSIVT